MTSDQINSTQINRQILLLAKPKDALNNDEQELVDEIKNRLYSNEHMREAIWSHFFPILILSLVFYTVISIAWLFYNFRSYNRQKTNLQKEWSHRKEQSSRRLEFYKQIPVETSDNGEIELVNDIKIIENGVVNQL